MAFTGFIIISSKRKKRKDMNKLALITGATSGIGKATAELLAKKGFDLILCGRRKDRLEELERTFTDINVHFLAFDIRDKNAVQQAIGQLPPGFQKIDILINNAGNAHGLDPIQNGNIDDWDAMMDINVKGLLYISRLVIPGMVSRKNGHIINIGSIAGKEVYPNGNVYCASKFAVDALTKGMRIDLIKDGVKVSAVHPGLVETEFSLVRFKGDEKRASGVYAGYKPLQPEDVAHTILFMIQQPAHVNLADMVILPSDQASSMVVHKGEKS
jgi:3-hydroxy acid dehydrogenase / malonic semialdehyde reductase